MEVISECRAAKEKVLVSKSTQQKQGLLLYFFIHVNIRKELF